MNTGTMNQKQLFTLILTLPLFFSSCLGDKDHPEQTENHVQVNDTLPDFTVKNAEGEELHTNELKGHVTLLVFFITTCPDCQRELPKIESLWETLKNDPDFALVTISRGETTATVNEFWKKQKFTMPFYLDPDKIAFLQFANSTVPRLYLTNQENKVIWMAIEELQITPEQILEKIRELQKGSTLKTIN